MVRSLRRPSRTSFQAVPAYSGVPRIQNITKRTQFRILDSPANKGDSHQMYQTSMKNEPILRGPSPLLPAVEKSCGADGGPRCEPWDLCRETKRAPAGTKENLLATRSVCSSAFTGRRSAGFIPLQYDQA